MRIGRMSRGYRPQPVTRKGRVGLSKDRKSSDKRPKKLQGSASFNDSLKEIMRDSFNTGGYASIQDMEKKCGSKTTKNRMK